MSTHHYDRNASGLQVSDISMHLPHPLASAFEYIARAGLKTADWREDCQKTLRCFDIEQIRRDCVSTQGFDSAVYALPAFRQWHVGDSATEVLRYRAMSAIVQTACNWMHPELLREAREAVVEFLEAAQ